MTAPAQGPRRAMRYDAKNRTLTITVDGKTTVYALEEWKHCQGPARAFRLTKIGQRKADDAPNYDVQNVTADKRSGQCECKGFLRWHHCKHVDSLAALIERGTV